MTTSPSGLAAAQRWLDALSSGNCDESTFLRDVQELGRKDPDAGWDLLSLLDQYYRRGKIKPDVFRAWKAKLEGQLLGGQLDIEVSIPLPPKDDPAAHDTIPIVRPEPAPAPQTQQPIAPPIAQPNAPPIAAAERSARPAHAGRVPAAARSAAAPSSRREIAVGDLLRGRHRIKRVLGKGGTATVYEALDQYRLELPNTGQRLAIKVLHATATERPEVLGELQREFQHLQALSHPNIIRVHEFDRDGDIAFFTMEYLSGLALSRVLAARHQTALPRVDALTVIGRVAAALAHAHARGVVHGDLNPGNIFITDDGEVRVLDFGAAQPRDVSSSDIAAAEAPVATPRFASCELLEGGTADVRDDVYALACLITLMLAGKHPFGEATALQARTQRLSPLRPSGLTGGQWRALRQGLAFDRDSRPPNVEQWLRPFKLDEASERLPPLLALLPVSTLQDRRRAWLAAAACLVAAAAIIWWVTANLASVAGGVSTAISGLGTRLEDVRASLMQRWHRIADASHASDDPGTRLPVIPPQLSEASSAAAEGSSAADHDSSAAAGGSSAAANASQPPPPSSPAKMPAAAKSRAASSGSSAASAAPQAVPARRARIELSAAAIDVPLDASTAQLVVRRTGNLRGPAAFSWWTEAGTAKPGQDFAAVSPRQAYFQDGKNTVSLYVPVVGDTKRRQPKSFYVVINDPSPDAALGAHTLTMVTLPSAQ